MNKIYRLIWNSALNTWVVASEAAKAHGKNGSRSRMAKLVMASTLLLPALAPDSVLAQWNNAGSSATGSGAVAAGGGTTGTAASATTSESVAIGDGATATSRKSGSDTGVGATAIGHGAQATTTYGGGPVAIGTSAKAIVSAGNGGSPDRHRHVVGCQWQWFASCHRRSGQGQRHRRHRDWWTCRQCWIVGYRQ